MPDVPCAHVDCPHFAICSIKTPTGWANLCKNHYLSHFNDEARAYCEARGLTTREKKLEFIRERLAGIGKPRHPRRWARELIARALQGERLLPIQLQFALEALGLTKLPTRVPGEDDDAAA